MSKRCLSILLLFVIFFWKGDFITGQIHSGELGGADLNTIHTSVPFLTIAPDARSAGMGDAGVATEPDVNSQHWNVAKYAFIEGKGGLSLSYTPWLSNLIQGINLGYLSTYYKINDKNILSSSLRYFSLGEIVFSNLSGGFMSSYEPIEFAVDAGYSRSFGDKFSAGIVFRYIHSDLTAGQRTPGGDETKPGTSFAGDLGLYYHNSFLMGEREALWALGLNLSNVGTPVSYTEDAEATPIPTNLRVGGRFQFRINSQHSIALISDISKLLVPTPPVYDTDTATGEYYIIRGKAAPESILAGMFQSFYDAPGVQQADRTYSVFQEEMHEIVYSFGLEYNFRDLLALRTGYFHEHASKGNRKYLSAGIGVMNPIFALDLSYLIPTNGQNSPLANTFRITFTINFGRSTYSSPTLLS